MICCQSLVDLEVSGGGAVLPASQGLDDSRATQRTGSFPVEPQTQALLAEHMLTEEGYGVSEISLTNSADIARLAALLTACPHSITLGAAEHDQGPAYGRHTSTDVKGLAKAVDDDEGGSQEVTVGGVFSQDVFVPQLDGHQGPKQLAQLLDQQVELSPGFEGQENLGQKEDKAFQANGKVLKDKVIDAHCPDQIKEV